MVDFDDLKGKAESLLGEHGDQVEEGIDKLADLAGQKLGHAGQIDQAADKLKDFVDKQEDGAQQRRPGPGAGAARQGAGQRQGGGPRPGGRPHGKQGGGPRAGGTGPGRRPGPKPGPPPQSD
jgi:MT0933-like antitoxin protein